MDEQGDAARRIWLGYISKLNDRAISRQQASGFTTWAVAGVIAVLLVKVIEHLPNVIGDPGSPVLHLTILTTTMDLFFFAGDLLHLVLFMGSASGEARLRTRMARFSASVIAVSFSALYLLVGASNIVVAFLAPAYMMHWPFAIIGVLLVVIAFRLPATRIRLWAKHREDFRDLPELSTQAFVLSTRLATVVCTTAIFFELLGMCFSLVPTIQFVPHVRSSSDAEVVLWSLYVTGMIILLIVLLFRLATHPYDAFLSQLERRIILESLSPDAIRAEFIRGFIGEDVRDWLVEAEGKLKRLYDEFDQGASKAEHEFADLAKIDRDMQFEMDGCKKVICETLVKLVHGYLDYAEKLTKQMEHLVDQLAPLACPGVFKQIVMDWERQSDLIKKRHRAICDCCQKATSGLAQTEPCEQRAIQRPNGNQGPVE